VHVESPPRRELAVLYGIDFATRAELIAGRLSPEEICASIGADTPRLRVTGRAHRGDDAAGRSAMPRLLRRTLPVPVGEDDRGKHVLDGLASILIAVSAPGVLGVFPGVFGRFVSSSSSSSSSAANRTAAAGVSTDAQLRTQPVKVCVVALVLELASNLHLLGLGSAAPIGSTPRTFEPVRP